MAWLRVIKCGDETRVWAGLETLETGRAIVGKAVDGKDCAEAFECRVWTRYGLRDAGVGGVGGGEEGGLELVSCRVLELEAYWAVKAGRWEFKEDLRHMEIWSASRAVGCWGYCSAEEGDAVDSGWWKGRENRSSYRRRRQGR